MSSKKEQVSTSVPTWEQVVSRVLNAYELEELEAAEAAVDTWLAAHPKERFRAGEAYGQIAMMRDAKGFPPRW